MTPIKTIEESASSMAWPISFRGIDQVITLTVHCPLLLLRHQAGSMESYRMWTLRDFVIRRMCSAALQQKEAIGDFFPSCGEERGKYVNTFFRSKAVTLHIDTFV